MRKTVVTAVAVLLALQLSVMSAFASVYEISDDTEILNTNPIFYSEDYEPGLINQLRDMGSSLFAVRGFGSFSQNGVAPYFIFTPSGANSSLYNLISDNYTVTTSSDSSSLPVSVNAQSSSQYVYGSGTFSLVLNGSNPYMDYSSSFFTYTQDTSGADTLVFSSDWKFNSGSLVYVVGSSTQTFYYPLIPVGAQIIADGQAISDILDVTLSVSPWDPTWTNGGRPTCTISTNGLKLFNINTRPELLGIRIFYDIASSPTSSGISVTNLTEVYVINSFSSSIPQIDYVNDSSIDGDLSGINSVLSNIFNLLNSSFFYDGNGGFLNYNGSILTVNESISFTRLIRNGFLGLRSFLVDSSGTSFLLNIFSSLSGFADNAYSCLFVLPSGSPILYYDGNVSSIDYDIPFNRLFSYSLIGLSQNIKDFNAYLENSTFSWQNYNLETHELDSVQTLTGQNSLFGTAFQSIEENLGRLTYVFANDDEIELRDQADPSVNQFKDSFGGGASAGDILEIADSVGEVQGMFDTGFGVNDLWDSLNGESWWSWFTTENAQALDSTGQSAAVGDDDPFNMQTYYDHLHAVEEIRNRGEGE